MIWLLTDTTWITLTSVGYLTSVGFYGISRKLVNFREPTQANGSSVNFHEAKVVADGSYWISVSRPRHPRKLLNFSHPVRHPLPVKLNLMLPPSTSRAPPSCTPPHRPPAHLPTTRPSAHTARPVATRPPARTGHFGRVTGTTTRPCHRAATKPVKLGRRPPTLTKPWCRPPAPPSALPPPAAAIRPPPSCRPPAHVKAPERHVILIAQALLSPLVPSRPAQVPERSPLPPHCRCRLEGRRGGRCTHCPIIHRGSRNLRLSLHYSIRIVDYGGVYVA
jgi:hypothetical protein